MTSRSLTSGCRFSLPVLWKLPIPLRISPKRIPLLFPGRSDFSKCDLRLPDVTSGFRICVLSASRPFETNVRAIPGSIRPLQLRLPVPIFTSSHRNTSPAASCLTQANVLAIPVLRRPKLAEFRLTETYSSAFRESQDENQRRDT